MLEKVKASLGITTQAFDEEITDNIAAALDDLGLTADVTNLDEAEPLIQRAIKTYCAWVHNANHGNMDFAESFKRSYDEIKSTLITSSHFTTWGE